MSDVDRLVQRALDVVHTEPSQRWRDGIRDAVEESYEQGRKSVAAEVAEAERRVRQAVWDYCDFSARLSEEAAETGNPYAVGLAKGYRDVQEKLAPALRREGSG